MAYLGAPWRLRTGVASLDLRPAASFRKVRGGLLLGRIAALDVIIHGPCAGASCQAGGHAFVLDHLGLAFDGGDPALNVNLELVRIDLGFGKLGANQPQSRSSIRGNPTCVHPPGGGDDSPVANATSALRLPVWARPL